MNYKVLIGLEMHCEISNTKTKVFSSAVNSFSELPNCNVRPVDMAFPGTLPRRWSYTYQSRRRSRCRSGKNRQSRPR